MPKQGSQRSCAPNGTSPCRALLEDPAGRTSEVVDDDVSSRAVGWALLFAGAVAGPHQHAPATDGAAQLDVHPAIADRERLARVDAEFGDCPIDQRASRLAAVAG